MEGPFNQADESGLCCSVPSSPLAMHTCCFRPLLWNVGVGVSSRGRPMSGLGDTRHLIQQNNPEHPVSPKGELCLQPMQRNARETFPSSKSI